MDVELATNYDQTVSDPKFFDKYDSKKKKLTKLMKDWEDIQLELEALV